MKVFLGRICSLIRKWFLKKLGPEKLSKMASAFGDNTGYAQTIFSYKESKDQEPILFIGRTEGNIVSPRGGREFGWDCVFQPKGYNQTYGELDSSIKNKISQRYKALQKLLAYFKK